MLDESPGNSACSTSLTGSPGSAWRSASIASSTRPTSSTSCRICSSCAACPATFVLIKGRILSPRQCERGLQLSAPRPRSSSRAALGRTATARASTRSFTTNSSTVKSSTASPRQRSSSKHGGATTTPSGLTHRSDTNHRRQRPLSGLQSQPDRFHQQRKQWPKSPSYIKTEIGPPQRGSPGACQECCCCSRRSPLILPQSFEEARPCQLESQDRAQAASRPTDGSGC